MEFLLGLTLFGSTIALGVVVLLALIALFVADYFDSLGGGLTVLACFVGMNFFWGNLPLNELFTLPAIGSYLAIGFIFALIRAYFAGRELKVKYQELLTSVGESSAKAVVRNYNLKAAVFRWWLMFPISLISWITGKLFKDVWNWTYSRVESLFNKIFFSSWDNKNPLAEPVKTKE